jgi:uncharacterized protein (TIGR02246 family)
MDDADGAVAEVRVAYDRLMTAFVAGNAEAYFACFHEDASFYFAGDPLLEPRSAYEAAWKTWEREGIPFTDVVADDVRIRVFGSTAVVTHIVRQASAEQDGGRERESIVFARVEGEWLAVHEHLSEDA